MKKKADLLPYFIILMASSFVLALEMPTAFQVASTASESLPQYFPSVAYSEEAALWLVVWQDGLPTGDETARQGRAQDIMGCRIRSDGTILDPAGFAICTTPDFQGRPVVASHGAEFMVLWQDMRTGKDWDVYAARVTADGVIRDENGFLVSGGEHNQCMPEVVYGGGNYYAVWLDARYFPEYRLFGGRVSATGSPLDGNGRQVLRITTDALVAGWRNAPFAPGKQKAGWHEKAVQVSVASLVSNGTVHLITAQANYNNQVYTLDQAYQGFYTQTVDAASGDTLGPSARRNLTAAIDALTGGYSELYQGNRLGLAPLGVGNGFLAGAPFFGAGFGAAADVRWVVFPVSSAGIPGMPKLIYTDSSQAWVGYRSYGKKPNAFRMASDNTHVLCVGDSHRHTGRDGDTDVIGVVLDTAGVVLEKGFSIASGGAVQSLPKVAAGPAGKFLVVWQEESRTQDSRIMARLITLQ